MDQNATTALGNHMLMFAGGTKSTTARPKIRQTILNRLQDESIVPLHTGFSEEGSPLDLRESSFVFGAFRSATRLLHPEPMFLFHTQFPSCMPSPPSPSSSFPILVGLSIRAKNGPPRELPDSHWRTSII